MENFISVDKKKTTVPSTDTKFKFSDKKKKIQEMQQIFLL